MMHRLLLAVACLALGLPAQAAGLTRLDPAGSRIAFAYTQMGVALEGQFKRFGGQIAFDPARPQAARARIEVELASIDTGLAEVDAELAGRDWFDTGKYPQARFEATALKALGGNRYQANGRLAIKGRSRAVGTVFTYTPDQGGGVFAGQLDIRRADYAIGEGEWRDFGIVGNEVRIRFRLRALP